MKGISNKYFAKSILKAGAFSLLVRVSGVVFTFLVSVFLARFLGADKYGNYSIAFSLILLSAVPSRMGLAQLVLRETSQDRGRPFPHWGRYLVSWSLSLSTKYCLTLLGLFLLALCVCYFLAPKENFLKIVSLGILSIFLSIILSYIAILCAHVRGVGLAVLGQTPDAIIRPFTFLCLIAICVYQAPAPTTELAISLNIVSSLVALTCAIYLIKRYGDEKFKGRALNEREGQKWIEAALPLAGLAAVQALNRHIDILMVGAFLSPTETGIFRASLSLSTLASFGLQAINLVFAPYYARYFQEKKLLALEALAISSARFVSLIALIVVVIFGLLGDRVLGVLFGEVFAAGYGALLIGSIAQLLNAITGAVAVVAAMAGLEKQASLILMAALAVNFLLNMFLIPLFGIEGAAIASLISTLAWNGCLWILVRRKIGIQTAAIKF